MTLRHITALLFAAFASLTANAQKFYNLTADELRVDSFALEFQLMESLSGCHRDTLYSYDIVYPEFIDMPAAEVSRYRSLTPDMPPAMPVVESRVVYDRKRPSLFTSFCPVVYRDGKYQFLVSFMLRRSAVSVSATASRVKPDDGNGTVSDDGGTDGDTDIVDVLPADRYAAHSVLREGKWAKIRVSDTGVFLLTESLIRQAGFTDLSKIKVYGYGGNLINETLYASDLVSHDDLKEVPICEHEGRRMFYARGPVSWSNATSLKRTRNFYSDYGYYFITQGDTPVATIDADTFRSMYYPAPEHFHQLYEVDGHAWFHGGRNLYDSRQTVAGGSFKCTFPANPSAKSGTLCVNVSSSNYCSVEVLYNDSVVGRLTTTNNEPTYIFGCEKTGTFTVGGYGGLDKNTVELRVLEGSNPMRLDYVSMVWDEPMPMADLGSASLPVPEYVCQTANQDRHADANADMVIIIPTSQKLLAQAQRIKEFHEQQDGMSVVIVTAGELYNEFSSGTPDASAYRRYLKMMYDRAQGDGDAPKYLLLFGDCVWDNRMLTSACSKYNPDDFLLAYEGENSFDKRYCYVDDGFFCMLDDGEGTRPMYIDKLDVAVGRFPVTDEKNAKVIVDKTLAYAANANGGDWQNTIMFMGDDGDANVHMKDVDKVANQVIAAHPEYVVKKVMWDSYTRVSAAAGYTYPEVTSIISHQQQQGALVMDYAGHGSEIQLSHERVLRITDFAAFSNKVYPLWITASCDIMPFDGVDDTVGETAVLNPKGGAVMFFGTARTVFANYNTDINSFFMKHVLTYDEDGRPLAVGEAQRRAKNDITYQKLAENTLHYTLLGDPALRLQLPTARIVIDNINGVDVADGSGMVYIKAGQLARLHGHVADMPDFNGTVTLTVRDNLETITTRDNAGSAAGPYTYTDRTKTVYNGSNTVKDGEFTFEFAVPRDINYSDESGLINVFAINDSHTVAAHGHCSSFILGGSEEVYNDSIGPSIYCYLNSPSFVNGGSVNASPYFVAEITDKDGINASGAGIGHDMQLIIDGRMEMTYSLNDNFEFDFGSYTSGSTYYNIPELEPGPHTLLFRAWDILNNVSIAQLSFSVDKGVKPAVVLSCTENPARDNTTFVLTHDRSGSSLRVAIEVLDMSGRLLWRHEEEGVSDGSVYKMDWNLTLDNGQRLDTGVYLYRAFVTSDGATSVSKARKLIVIGK